MQWIKKVYLYLVSVITLVIAVVGAIMLINLALKAWVFTKADSDHYALDYYRCAANVQNEGGAAKPVPAPDVTKCTTEEETRLKQEQAERKSAQRQRDAAQAVAMILVATPVWWYHWKLARKEV
jgi:hypothetical protein